MNRTMPSTLDERLTRMLSGADEERIRRASRHLIQGSRGQDGRVDAQYVFDLLGYLHPNARAIFEDEAAQTLADLIGNA